MNRDYSLIHWRFPFSSFLLFILLTEGKKCKEWPGKGKELHYRFAVANSVLLLD